MVPVIMVLMPLALKPLRFAPLMGLPAHRYAQAVITLWVVMFVRHGDKAAHNPALHNKLALLQRVPILDIL